MLEVALLTEIVGLFTLTRYLLRHHCHIYLLSDLVRVRQVVADQVISHAVGQLEGTGLIVVVL